MRPFSVLSGLVVLLLLGLVPTRASADAALTPTLTPLGRHVEAELELGELVSVLPAESRALVQGIYVAFAPTPVDVIAEAACDDDGDPVIVLSDAMLVLLENVTHAEALDVGAAHANVTALATHYARDQRAGERLLPPGAGAFEAKDSRALEHVHTARFREALSGVLGHELSIFVRSELGCWHPTATHERGDDVWTEEEATLAHDIGAKLYAKGRLRGRDRDAVLFTVATKGDARGYIGWLAFLSAMDAANAHTAWSYTSQRPDSARRLQVVEEAAIQARNELHRNKEDK